jgi:hypothetical protein
MGSTCRIAMLACISALLLFGAAATAATGTIGIQVHPGGGTVCLGTVCQETAARTERPILAIVFRYGDRPVPHAQTCTGRRAFGTILKQVYHDPIRHLSCAG